MNTEIVAGATSVLFVPGDRPDRFIKAHTSGADLIILDLEDAVALKDKKTALDSVVAALSSQHDGIDGGRLTSVVRINSEQASLELAALRDVSEVSGNGLLGVVVPKAESATQIADVARALPQGMAIIALIETAQGLINVNEVASAPCVTRLAFGAVDFSADVDGDHPELLSFARSQIVIASAAAGIAAPLDSPSLAIKEQEQTRAESNSARAFGFGGKLCIHPAQLDAVHQGFRPSEEQIAWAKKILEHEGSATQVDGIMIDKPVIDKAKKLLARVKEK